MKYYVICWMTLKGRVKTKQYKRYDACKKFAATLIIDNNCDGEVWIDEYTNNVKTNREIYN